MIFYFNPFSLIIFYHSVWLGFELFELRVQVCSQLVQFTLVRKGYDNHHRHNKPKTGNWAGMWMASCPDEMGREFGSFWKRVSYELTLDNVGRQLGSLPLRQTVEVEDLRLDHAGRQLSSLPLEQRMEFSAIELSSDYGVEKLRLDHEMCRTWVGVVSIVWYERLLRIVSLSPRVEEMKSEVDKCVRTWTTESPVFCISLYLHLHMNCCYWDHCDCITIIYEDH